MKTKQLIYLAVIIIVVLGIFTGVGAYISYNNTEVSLRNEADAQRGVIEGTHDKMWKVISQKAEISDQYASKFDTIYQHIISGRYSSGDGTLMKWIKESNPQFDSSMYKDLMQSVEILRSEFLTAQERMLDIQREHKNLCEQIPSKFFISNSSPIEYTMVTSTKSKEVMKTGIDDDTDLFKK